MKLTLTNETQTEVPVCGENGKFVNLTGTESIDWSGTDVLVIGDKPNVTEKLVDAIGDLAKAALHKLRLRKKGASAPEPDLVVTIKNDESATQRVILGDGVTDIQLAPGDTYRAVSPEYIEIRTLGHAPQQGGTPD